MSTPRTPSYLERCVTFSTAVVVAICGMALCGWLFDSLPLAAAGKSFIPMAPNTALLFILLCGSISLRRHLPERREARLASWLVALFVAVYSALIFADFFLGAVEWNLDAPLFATAGRCALFAGRMSPITAAALASAGAAILLFSAPSRNVRILPHISSLLASAVTVTGFVLLIGYLHGSPFLYGGTVVPVALPTAVCLFIIGAGLCAATGPDAFPQRLLLGSSVHARLMRAFLPVTVGIVLIHGLLYARLYGRLANPSLISSLMTLVSLAVVGLVITVMAKIISNRIEAAERERDRMQVELMETNEQLRILSNTDPLTHLYNRRYLMESLDRELKRMKRHQGHLALVMIDADHFKLINDVYGHPAGDSVLVAMAQEARKELRCYEIAARYGGEEFVLLLPETTLQGGVVVAERLLKRVQALTFPAPMENLAVTVSAGVAAFSPRSEDSLDALVIRADEALYRAKRNGRNRVEVMTHAIDTQVAVGAAPVAMVADNRG